MGNTFSNIQLSSRCSEIEEICSNINNALDGMKRTNEAYQSSEGAAQKDAEMAWNGWLDVIFKSAESLKEDKQTHSMASSTDQSEQQSVTKESQHYSIKRLTKYQVVKLDRDILKCVKEYTNSCDDSMITTNQIQVKLQAKNWPNLRKSQLYARLALLKKDKKLRDMGWGEYSFPI